MADQFYDCANVYTPDTRPIDIDPELARSIAQSLVARSFKAWFTMRGGSGTTIEDYRKIATSTEPVLHGLFNNGRAVIGPAVVDQNGDLRILGDNSAQVWQLYPTE